MTKLNYQTPGLTPAPSLDSFKETTYVIRQKVMKLFGASFYVQDAAGQTVLFSNQKAFKLREDIRIYTGEDMKTEMIAIRTAKIIDFSATYQVIDSATGGLIGALQRKGMKSLFRDEWDILDARGAVMGRLIEDSGWLAVFRRLWEYATLIVPESFHVEIGGQRVARMAQNRNPFVKKLTLDFSEDPGHLLDRRLGIAAGVVLSAIEGRQG